MILKTKNIYLMQFLIVVSLIFCWRFELGDLLSFIGSLIGMFGAYYISKIDKNIAAQDKKNIIYQMLDYTLKSTESHVIVHLESIAGSLILTGDEYGIEDDLLYNMYLDYENLELSNPVAMKIYKTTRNGSNAFNPSFRRFNRLIYYNNWDECIPYIKEKYREDIIEWISYLRDSDLNLPDIILDFNIDYFISMREKIVYILNESSQYKHKIKKEYETEIFSEAIRNKDLILDKKATSI